MSLPRKARAERELMKNKEDHLKVTGICFVFRIAFPYKFCGIYKYLGTCVCMLLLLATVGRGEPRITLSN